MKLKMTEELYNTIISCKYTNLINNLKNTKNIKLDDVKLDELKNEILIPNFNSYSDIFKYNYNIAQLKTIIKYYKLKVSGNKEELKTRIFYFLFLSTYIIKIQQLFRGHLQRKINKLRGPAYLKRKICTNNTDFITMDPLEKIDPMQFISFKDVDNFIYGFDIVSFYNLVLNTKNESEIKNPYNRTIFPAFVFQNIKKLIKLNLIFKKHINLYIEDDIPNISNKKVIELRALSLFQNINSLGNYSDPQWFLSLNRIQLFKFMRELNDIWSYRAQLTLEVKYNICPPNGNPFQYFSIIENQNELDIYIIFKNILVVLERLVNSGINTDNKVLGSYYVLSALTLVNADAAIALPWLYESVNSII